MEEIIAGYQDLPFSHCSCTQITLLYASDLTIGNRGKFVLDFALTQLTCEFSNQITKYGQNTLLHLHIKYWH